LLVYFLTFFVEIVNTNMASSGNKWRTLMDRWFAEMEKRPAQPPHWIASRKLPIDPISGEPVKLPPIPKPLHTA